MFLGVVCPPPKEVVDRGHLVAVQRTEYDVGDTIYYLCKKTFLLDGPNQVTCLPNGTWSAEPACRGKGSGKLHRTFRTFCQSEDAKYKCKQSKMF